MSIRGKFLTLQKNLAGQFGQERAIMYGLLGQEATAHPVFWNFTAINNSP